MRQEQIDGLNGTEFITVGSYVRRRRKFRSKVPELAARLAGEAHREINSAGEECRRVLGLSSTCPICGHAEATQVAA